MAKGSKKVEETATVQDFQKFKPIPVELLKKAPWNYKTNDDLLQQKLIANIKRSGQIENVLVRPLGDGTYEVVNGNHRLDALVALGYKEVFSYDLGEISESQAKRIAIETNETRFESDPMSLARIVSELNTEFEDFSTTAPFTTEQMENYDNLLKFDWDAEDPESEDEIPDEEESKEKGNRTETLLSVGGESFKTVKFELSTAVAERFTEQIQRLRGIYADSADSPISLICDLLEAKTDEQLVLDRRPAPNAKSKKSSKK